MKTKTKSEIVERIIHKGQINPKDEIVIKYFNGISDSISVQLISVDPSEKDGYFAFPNKKEAWEWLRKFNQIGGRKVWVETDREGSKVPYHKSAPFEYRFGKATQADKWIEELS